MHRLGCVARLAFFILNWEWNVSNERTVQDLCLEELTGRLQTVKFLRRQLNKAPQSCLTHLYRPSYLWIHILTPVRVAISHNVQQLMPICPWTVYTVVWVEHSPPKVWRRSRSPVSSDAASRSVMVVALRAGMGVCVCVCVCRESDTDWSFLLAVEQREEGVQAGRD